MRCQKCYYFKKNSTEGEISNFFLNERFAEFCFLNVLTGFEVIHYNFEQKNSNNMVEISANVAKFPALTQACRWKNVEFFMKYGKAPAKSET